MPEDINEIDAVLHELAARLPGCTVHAGLSEAFPVEVHYPMSRAGGIDWGRVAHAVSFDCRKTSERSAFCAAVVKQAKGDRLFAVGDSNGKDGLEFDAADVAAVVEVLIELPGPWYIGSAGWAWLAELKSVGSGHVGPAVISG